MRLVEWLLRRRRDDDLQDEIRAHLSMAARDRVEDGQDAASARLAALKEFGNVTLTREATRRAWGGRWRERVNDLAQDVRYAVRLLGRSPGYALVVIAVIALGVGANVAVFSLFKSIALKPLPGVEDSGALAVLVARTNAGRIVTLSHPDFRDIRDQDSAFAGLAGTTKMFFTFGLGTRGERVAGELVTGNYFQVLGVRAQLGRTLLPSDDEAPGRHPVVVISDAMWKRVLGSDPQIVGKTIQINGYPFTVVGVADREFRGTIVSMVMDVFIPTMMQPRLQSPDRLSLREAPLMWGLGRLRPGTSIAEASAQADVLSARLAAAHPERTIDQRATVIPIWQSPYGAQTYMLPAVLMMSVMGALLLLIVCANVANLVLVRGVRRRSEIAARLAVGASRWRILRLLVIENLVLALPGGIAGMLMAHVLFPLLLRSSAMANPFSQSYLDVSTDGLVVAFALVVSCGSALVFGLVPALRLSRVDLASIMKDDLSPRAGSRGRVRAALVVSQVAVSLLLLVGAGLVVRSLDAAGSADPGFNQHDVALVSLDVGAHGYDADRGRVFFERLLEAARAEPGIDSASLGERRLLTMVDGPAREIAIEGYRPRDKEDTVFLIDSIATDYFRTLRIPLIAGRDFDRHDDQSSRQVVIVNETLARRFWGTEREALGKRLRVSNGDWRAVVGVVRDIKYARITEGARPHVYLPFEQFYLPNLTLLVRGRDVSASTLVEKARAQVWALDATMPILQSRMLTDDTRSALTIFTIAAGVLSAFGVIAMALAALGIYGLVSYSAKQRTHEIGIRMAVGADRGDVVRQFLAEGLRLGAWGAAAGLVAALGLTRLLESLLYGVSTTDAVSFGSAFAAVLGLVLGASFVPARRAARTDPIVALRHR